jgi:hypothetical protein
VSHSIAPKQAQNQLDKQIEVLSELRNAGTRAAEFREWRQSTLTLIERIWPDQATRATRFRRIPFSPATAKADDRVTREAFERGCAEARRLLKLWQAEITTHGVTQIAEAPRLAEAVRQTLVEMRPKPAPEAPRGRPGAKGPRRSKKEPLGEMLGLAKPPVVPGGPMLPPEFEMAEEGAAEKAAGPALDPADRFADPLALSINHALERARKESKSLRPPPEPMDPMGRSHEPVPAIENRNLVSYVARAFIGMAGDVEELGVPETHRDRVRLALFDLAHHLDCGSVTWDLMRDAVTLVMHYPALGRQALPLLLPYLENAA